MLPMSEGIVNGETLRGPRSASTFECWVSKVYIPPMPEPMITPTRSVLPGHVQARIATACFAATKPKCV
jgi:hypothetical protein